MGKGMQRLENPALPRIGFKEKRQPAAVIRAQRHNRYAPQQEYQL
jgi:hypothetical protein